MAGYKNTLLIEATSELDIYKRLGGTIIDVGKGISWKALLFTLYWDRTEDEKAVLAAARAERYGRYMQIMKAMEKRTITLI